MAPPSNLWVPKDVLRVDLSSLTCVGYVPSKGRRCHNHIAAASSQEADNLLFQMSTMNISDPRVDNALEPLARLLICKQGYQDQVAVVATRWRNQIQRHQIIAATRQEPASQLERDARLDQVAVGQDVVRDEHAAGVERATAPQSQQAAWIHARKLEGARQEADIARRDIEITRRDTTIALQNATIARRDADLARQETNETRQEIRSLRLETARGIKALTIQLAQLQVVVNVLTTPGRTSEVSGDQYLCLPRRSLQYNSPDPSHLPPGL
ncbi:MAG: hypothetical protein Q9175_005408 [Cornicularia normoerica]